MLETAYIALGSNLGDRSSNIRGALDAFKDHPGIELVVCSSVIETDPVGPEGQGPYLNAVACVRTGLEPRDLLDALLAIEQCYGRDRACEQRWGPRTLDLDLLIYADRVIDEPGLSIPHPRLHERDFVLIPLAEIAPEIMVPIHEKTPRDMLGALRGSSQS
jgi:2-amino-4-hydroxy-6-hydroxymethyldihydropteridine diphosphokinase